MMMASMLPDVRTHIANWRNYALANQSVALLLVLCTVVSLCAVGSGYLPLTGILTAGLLAMPWLLVPRPAFRRRWYALRYAIPVLIVALGSLWAPARTLYFFSLGFLGLLLWENRGGRGGWQPAAALVIISSAVANWIAVFGFSLRLELSRLAATGLAAAGFAARAEGNIIVLRGQEFSVDPACMGLSMLQMGLLLLCILTALHERRDGRYLPVWAVAGLFAVTLLLLIVFNLLRIMLLCLFGWMPGTLAHEAAGLFGFILYVALPVGWLTQRVHQYAARSFLRDTEALVGYSVVPRIALPVVAVWLFCAWSTMQVPRQWPRWSPPFDASQLQYRQFAHGVEQYYGNGLLLYAKPLTGFYQSEHTPLICWQGSGYAFAESRQDTLAGQMVYLGKLQKKAADGQVETLHTAWWYDNGAIQTTSQWVWRKTAAAGAPPFFLVNISAESMEQLRHHCAQAHGH